MTLKARKKQSGFSLIELLIVVAIILIIAAIAIPNLLAARKSSNNTQAAANVKTINTAVQQFSTSCAGNLPADIPAIAISSATWSTQAGGVCGSEGAVGVGGLIPASFLTNPVGSFTYTYTPDGLPADGGYTITAVCAGGYGCSDAFYMDGNGVYTHANDGAGTAAPTAASTPVGK